MRTTTTGYLPGNGLEMYYEIHGEGQPLVLLHGAFVAIGTSFGEFLPGLAEGRKVVAFELQGTGTRPTSIARRATRRWPNVIAAIDELGLGQVDLFGYSMGAFVALLVTLRCPGLMDGLGKMTPDMMHGSPFHDRRDEDIRAIEAPTLVIIGDSDPVRPEHAVEMFRLLGGGVFGGMPPGMPASQLAVLPGTSHVSIASRADLVVPIVTRFLDMP